MTLFVYVTDFAKRPQPQVWPADLPHEHHRVVAKHTLQPNEETLSLDQLRRLYPPPETAHG